ncbi:MAG: carboxypeptidase-like regulatory domain-containing protein, partial [Alistipes senegalensis]|uniref:STN domain-containing protein n=1 Tax=Alistipes senegalensis TaxID=1288121 RepID=UPI00242BE2EC
MNKKIIQRISLLILLFVLPVAYPVNDVHAQDVRVTIRMDKVRMEQVMNEIERQTKYLFGSADNVDVNRIVTVQVVDRPLREALDAMLRGTNISYMVQGSNIVLKNRRSEADANRPVTVSGIVRDVAGNPVVGAAVVVKGTTIGVSTDIEGRFALQVPPPASQAVLEINYLGYEPTDVRVGSVTHFDITLKEDSQQISDVLVVGYTPMRK